MIRFIIVGFNILLILNSCTSPNAKNLMDQDTNLDTKSLYHSNEISIRMQKIDTIKFQTLYKSILDKKMSDEKNYTMLIGNFFEKENSPDKDYALFFRYIIKHKDETFDEPFGSYTYDIFKKYQGKGNVMLNYINTLPEEDRRKLLLGITNLLCLELNAEGYTIATFEKDFPFLSDSIALENVKACFDNWVK